MIKKEVTIINKLGLHARAAAKFVTVASRFEAEISVSRGDRNVNGKSIMGIMMLAASKNTTITLTITGIDEEQATTAICELIANRFDEPE